MLRFTGTPWRAFGSGALTTILIQSSTATTVTLIGFVSAGLISFSHAIGVVIGASLGTTATGWFVAGLGLKINLGLHAAADRGGALLRLLAQGRWRHLGLALAGFGMLFLGLSHMQDGMQGLSSDFDLKSLPDTGWWAHLAAMLLGILLTIVLQSSTAAVATTLTALHAATISFDQAAAIVVGAAIGTTFTGALVTIGGTISAKRTALAHVLFNLGTGTVAILLLPAFLNVLGWLHQHIGLESGAMSLAMFHTLFIAVGVAIFMPFVSQFERFVERILPQPETDSGRYLDASTLGVPAVALEASQRALESIAHELVDIQRTLLRKPMNEAIRRAIQVATDELNQALHFIARLSSLEYDPSLHGRRVAQLHTIDHLLRLCARLQRAPELLPLDDSPEITEVLQRMERVVDLVHEGLYGRAPAEWLDLLHETVADVAQAVQVVRRQLLSAQAGESNLADALQTSDALRSMDRAAIHIERVCHYLLAGRQPSVEQGEG